MTALIYPRGFVGFGTGVAKDQPNPAAFLQAVRASEFNRPAPREASAYDSNPVIDALWREYVGGNGRTSSFEFRERILVAALSAFGTTSFYDWCVLQATNPFFSAMHKRFLNDTFQFIDTGKRSMGITTWLNIVRIDSSNVPTGDEGYNIKQFFRQDEKNTMLQRSSSMDEMIASWTSQEGGFEDLLGTLMILFGAIN